MPMMPEKMDENMMGGAERGAPPAAEPPANDAMAAEVQRLASEAPMLPKPVQAKRIAGLVAQFNKTVEAMGGKDPSRDEVPDLVWESAEPKVIGQFPAEVYVPMAVLQIAVQNTATQAQMPALAKKYDLDLKGLDTDGGIAFTTGVLKKMAGDKRLTEIMHNPPAAPPPAPAKGGAPKESPDADLMAGM